MKRFIDDLREELNKRGMSADEIAEIIADHEEMISAAIAGGLNEEELKSKFGDPRHLADELAGDKQPEKEPSVQPSMNDSFSLWQTFDVSDEKQSVEVSLLSEDTEYFVSTQDRFEIFSNRHKRLSNYILSYKDNVLTLKRDKTAGVISFIPFRFGEVSFRIGLPANHVIGHLSHTSVNADVQFQGVKINTFKLVTTNGDVSIESSNFGDATWNTVNGDLQVQSAQFGSISSTQVSGDLNFRDSSVANTFKIHTVSGDAAIENCDCDLLDLESVSGDVVGKNLYPKRASLKSVSGDIMITNQEKKPIEIIKSHSVSGDIKIQ